MPVLPKRRVGPYRIERRLGAGGMGVVYLGHDDSAGVAAAVKLLKPEYVADPQFRDRLRREVVAARRVPRFCTAAVLDADLDTDPPWVATEYIDAPSLDVVLLEQGRLPEVELETFAVGVAVALRAIHRQGVVHRDLKPSNILLSRVGPRVIDFGIARLERWPGTTLDQLTPTGAVVGTPKYMAPEQLRGELASATADVFAWAGLVTYAATGRAPFGAGETVPDAILFEEPDLGEPGELAEPLRGLVTAAFAKDPVARPSAAELVDRLSAGAPDVTTRVLATAGAAPAVASGGPAATSGGTLSAAAEPATAPGEPPAVRWSRRRALAALAGAAGVAVAAAATVRWRSSGSSPAGQIGEPLTGHAGAVESVAVGEVAGAPVAVSAGGFDHTVRVWDLTTGAQLGEPLTAGLTNTFLSVVVGQRDGVPVAVSGGTGAASLQVWDLSSGEPVDVPFGDRTEVSSVAVGELDGAPIVVSGHWDNTVRVWDLSTGDQIGNLHPAYADPDRQTVDLAVAVGELAGVPIAVAGGLQSPRAQVWDLSSREQIGELVTEDAGGIGSVALSELAGTPVALSGGPDRAVRVWDLTTGAQLDWQLTGHTDHVTSVAFGELAGVPIALSGAKDHTVRVWNLRTGEQIGPELTGHTGTVASVAFGELAGAPIAVSAGGYHDSTVRRWRLPSSANGG